MIIFWRILKGFVADNLVPLLAVLGAVVFVRHRSKIEDLNDEVNHYKVKEEADEIRDRPVPRDKPTVLDRM